MTDTLPAVQYAFINRDLEFSVYFTDQNDVPIDQTGRQYTFKLYSKPGTVLLTVTWGAGVSLGDAAGGRIDIAVAAAAMALAEAPGASAEMIRTDTGSDSYGTWPVRLVKEGSVPLAYATGMVTVQARANITMKAINAGAVAYPDFDGVISYGDSTAGVAMLKDIGGNHLVAYNPAGGPALIDGDRPPFGIPRVILFFGQSNMASGIATTARLPPIHTAPLRPKRFWMFEAATLEGLQNTDITTLDLRRLVPGRETNAETYISAFMTELIAYQDSLGMPPVPWIALNVARSSATYAQIKKPTNAYNNAAAALTQLKKLFGQVIVEAKVGDHGEDESATAMATYKGYMQEIDDDWNVDLPAVTGQTLPIPMFLMQVPTLATNGLGQGVQDAILSLHADAIASPSNRQIFALGNRYHVGYGDTLHCNSIGAVRIGAMAGRMVGERLYGAGHTPLYMTGASKSGSVITVTTSAVYGLEEGATPAGTPTGTTKGFIVTDSGDTPKAISTVVASSTSIIITLSVAAAIGDKVKYARQRINSSAVGPGSWGVFRDAKPGTAAINKSFDLKPWLMAGLVTVA